MMKGDRAQFGVGPHLAQQVVAGHRLHVPIGNHKAVALFVHLRERRAAVIGVVDIGEADLLQEIADDPDHGGIVVHHEHRHRRIERHSPQAPRLATNDAMVSRWV
jgi:hypothetical protein